MSRALDLSLKFGARKIPVGTDTCPATYSMTAGMVEAFYHAARAEALRDAADEVHKLFMEEVESQTPRYHDVIECCAALRAMADREGVQ